MNGNDLIEYEKDNAEQLFESFTAKFKTKWELYKNSTEENFIEKYPHQWAEHVEEEYNNSHVEEKKE